MTNSKTKNKNTPRKLATTGRALLITSFCAIAFLILLEVNDLIFSDTGSSAGGFYILGYLFNYRFPILISVVTAIAAMVCSNVISYRLLGVYAIVINILLVVPLAGFFYTFKLPALGIIPMIFLPPVIVIYRQTKQK